jgi:hypothetical protein
MFVAILTSATMFSSCVDYVDNPVTPVPEPVETEKQAQFWSKFDKWQTDSCTVGDDFYMHMLHNFWWNPKDIYPNGLSSYAETLQKNRVTAMEQDNTDADLKILKDVCEKASAECTVSEEELMETLNPRVEELWQNATTMEQAMEAWGRATAAGYNDSFAPVQIPLKQAMKQVCIMMPLINGPRRIETKFSNGLTRLASSPMNKER